MAQLWERRRYRDKRRDDTSAPSCGRITRELCRSWPDNPARQVFRHQQLAPLSTFAARVTRGALSGKPASAKVGAFEGNGGRKRSAGTPKRSAHEGERAFRASHKGDAMKKLLVVAAAVALFATLSTTTAAAQNRVLGKADVPFSFAAHQMQLEPGTYVVRQIGRDILRLESASGGQGITLIGSAMPASANAKLVFHRYGTQAFLVAVEGPVAGAELPKTTEEKKAASRTRELTRVALAIH
jgi:hypothetical protein